MAHYFGRSLVELTGLVVDIGRRRHRCILVALAVGGDDSRRSFTRWIVTKLSLMLVINVGLSLGSLVVIKVMVIFIRALMVAVIMRLFNGGQLITVNCCGLILVV